MTLGNKLREAAEDHTRRARSKSGRSTKDWLHLVDVDDFLETMEVLNVTRATADERLFSCPFPGHTHGDTRPSAYMNDGAKEKSKATVWKCHGCGRSGNAISFYAELENVSKQEAAAHLREQYAPNFRAPKGGSISAEFEQRQKQLRQEAARARTHETSVIPYAEYERRFAVDWYAAEQTYAHPDCPPEVAYMFERGFTADTLTAWEIGYDDLSERITIPVYNDRGQLVGVKGRTWKSKQREKIKYLILGDREGKRKRYGWSHYEKSLIVFGLDKLDGPVQTLVLVEGELDVIALWQVGIPAVCTGSAHLSTTQAQLVRQWCDEVIVLFDSNTAGENATFGRYDKDGEFHPGVIHALAPHIRVRVAADHDDDPSQWIQDDRIDYLHEVLDGAISSFRLLLE